MRDSDLSSEHMRTWSTRSSSVRSPAPRFDQHSSTEVMAAKVTKFASLTLNVEHGE